MLSTVGADPNRHQDDINTQPLGSSGVESNKSIQYIPDGTVAGMFNQPNNRPNVAIHSGMHNMIDTDGTGHGIPY